MASKLYQASETPTVWTSSGGDKLLDLGSLIASSLAMGAYLDLGVSPRSEWYEVVLKIGGFLADPYVQNGIELRLSQSNSTTGFDGNPTIDPTASVEGSITFEQSINCKLARTLITVSTSTSQVLVCRTRIRLVGRYVSPIVFNRTHSSFHSTGTNHSVTLTPIPRESQ